MSKRARSSNFRKNPPPGAKPVVRIINRDGSINAWLPDRRKIEPGDLYHSMLSLSWPGFFGFITLVYLTVNLLFATAYYLCGPQALEAVSQASGTSRFVDTFFFSVQTLATIGYGKLTPVSLAANVLVTLEALTGLLSLAVATGLLFSRFSKPTARIVFSEFAVVNRHEGVSSLIFRIANERFNKIAAAQVQVVALITETTAEGEKYRTPYDLELERDNTPLFGLSWTVVHPINKGSPLHALNEDGMREREVEILVSVSGLDETFMQTIYSRWSYSPDEILWDMRHVDIMSRCEGRLTIDMDHFHDVEEVSAPL